MKLLQYVGISDTFQRCAECGYLIRPGVLAQFHDARQAKFHCFRCYHILAAVQVMKPNQQGGA